MNRNNEVERFKHAGRTIVIEIDRDPINPCVDYENFTKILCWHRRASLGNATDYALAGMSEEADVCEYLNETEGETVLAILPVYLFQHSGMTVRTTPFGDPYDSGQVGWAFVTEENARKMMGEGVPIPSKEELTEYIVGDVKTYDLYLTGEVYGYRVLGMNGDDAEELDSCWGFFGNLDEVIAEAKSAAEGSEDPAIHMAAEELAARATYAAGGAL